MDCLIFLFLCHASLKAFSCISSYCHDLSFTGKSFSKVESTPSDKIHLLPYLGTSTTQVFDEQSPSGNDYLAEVNITVAYI